MSIKDFIKKFTFKPFGKAKKIDQMNPTPVPVDPKEKEK